MFRRSIFYWIILFYAPFLGASTTPTTTPIPRPQASPQATATETPDPISAFWEDYREILKNYVDPQGMVDYDGLKTHREKLDHAVEAVGKLDPAVFDGWTSKDKVAFYLNAYNLLVLQTVVDNYPIKPKGPFGNAKTAGIKDITGALNRVKHEVMGQSMTLDHIEHDILRRQFDEPRVLFALVPASKGGAVLRTEPYEGNRLEEELDVQAHRFLADAAKFKIDEAKRKVFLSPIFSMYGSDFIGKYGPQSPFKGYTPKASADLHFISRHLMAAERRPLLRGKFKVEYLGYDWSLNEQPEK